MHRGPDIDGAEIPLVFWEFARGLGAERMEHVLRHNAQDIASLAALFVHMSWCFLEPESDRIARSREFEGLARHFEKRGDTARAARLYERAIELAPDRAREEALLLRLATLRRRNQEWDLALRVWRSLLDGGLTTAHEATISIAKHLEHRARDYAGALAAVRKLERTLELQQELEDLTGYTGGASLILRLHGEELRARRERLERRVRAMPAEGSK
jgi:tetratricopeptide (TPR) repeat protein